MKEIHGWRDLEGILADSWTPEWQAAAEARKQRATETLERVYAAKDAGATEIKAAEREWELADDELDGGPFPDAEMVTPNRATLSAEVAAVQWPRGSV